MTLCQIPTIEILQINNILGVKKTGHTRAIEAICNNNSDEFISCIIKPYCELPLGNHTCARELIGSILGIAFGLRVPKPYIIQIDNDSHLLTDDIAIKNRLLGSIGPNFGCKYIDTGPVIANYVNREDLPKAALIFAFDLLIQNDDRKFNNPNMFQDNDGFTIFDHEMAFPYSRPDMIIGTFPKPWEFTNQGSIDYKNHFCYKFLKNETIDLSSFLENLKDLEGVLPDIITHRIPVQWSGQEITNIIDYLILASNNAALVVSKIYEVLA